jgi:multiple sugar transport system substrate-binding protein
MSTITRRKLVGQAAALAGATTVANAAITSAAPGTSATSNRAPAQEKTEIILYHIWGTPPGGTPAATPAPMTQVIEAFNKQSTTAVIKDQTPGNYYETLQKTQADIAAGNPPDLVSVPWAFLDYAVEGLGVRALEDIAGEGFADLQTMMKPDAWPLVTKDDVIYGFPWGLSTPILYYNADIFEQAGVDPATAFDTWERCSPSPTTRTGRPRPSSRATAVES